MTNYRRLTKKSREKLTPEQRAERTRVMNALRQKRVRAKLGKEGRRARKAQEDARCYRWEAILPHVVKEPETGCWIWTGSFQRTFSRIRPVVRAGLLGKQYADTVVACLHRQKPIPPRCFVRTSCGRIECVSPEHILVTNQSVERAKRRLAHVQEEEREQRTG